MEPADIASLFFADEESAPQKAAALARALRGQQQLGTLGLLTGDKVLGGVGQQMLANASQQQEAIPRTANMRLQRQMEAQKAQTEADWRHTQAEHMTAQEALGRAQLDANRYKEGALGVIDSRTGKLDQYVKPPKEPTSKELETQWKGLTDALSTTHGRSNLNVEQQKRLYAGDRIKAIAMNPDGTPKDLNPNNMSEVGMLSAALAAGSSPTQHAVESMTPSSVGSDWAKIQQWLTNEPKGAGQQKFVQLMLDQAHREEETIKPQIRAAQLQALPNYAHLSAKDKVRYESLLKSNGIDPSSVDEKGLERVMEKAAGASAHPEANAALEWAKANPTDARAQKILQRLGAGR